jgi:hypothetical protein
VFLSADPAMVCGIASVLSVLSGWTSRRKSSGMRLKMPAEKDPSFRLFAVA